MEKLEKTLTSAESYLDFDRSAYMPAIYFISMEHREIF